MSDKLKNLDDLLEHQLKDLYSAETRAMVGRYVLPLLAQQADTLVLGCTHYPFLAALIREIAGPDVTIIDPSPAIARELRRRLSVAGLLAPGDRTGAVSFWSSAATGQTQRVIAQLWQADVKVSGLPDSAAVPANRAYHLPLQQ